MGSFKMDCRGAFLSRPFWFSAGLVTLALALGCFDGLRIGILYGVLDPCGLLFTALRSQALFMTLPVITAIPYGAAFLEELKTGFWKAALHRTTRRRYVSGKLAVGWLAGAGAVAVGCLWFYLITEAFSFSSPRGSSALLFPLCMEILCGGLCGEASMAAALLWGSKATAYFIPFLCAYLLVILGTRYFPTAAVLNPVCWMELGWAALAIPAALGLLCGVFLWFYGQRRLLAA